MEIVYGVKHINFIKNENKIKQTNQNTNQTASSYIKKCYSRNNLIPDAHIRQQLLGDTNKYANSAQNTPARLLNFLFSIKKKS